MSYCSNCGAKLPKDSKFCAKCGKETTQKKDSIEKKEEETKEQPTQRTTNSSSSNQNSSAVGWVVAIIVLIMLMCGGLLGLCFLGAKGQPGTVMKPSNVKTPQTLSADKGVDTSIQLNWKASGSKNITKYNIYKSKTNASDFELLKASENISNLSYTDKKVEKGQTYYYVVTAVSADGTESGNSNQASFALQADPIIPKGIQSWQDVLKKFDADKKYAEVFKKVTGQTREDIEYFVNLESQGKKLTTKLLKGSIITNTTENYVILYNYQLPEDKYFLTDQHGNPYVMMWCGNPVKLVSKVTTLAKVAQTVQNTFYNIIYILPAPVTNIFIYAAQPVTNIITTVAPNTFGPTMLPGDIYIDTVEDFGIDDVADTSDLEAGQQWAVEGHLLIEANPHDPAEYEDVVMTAKLTNGQSGVNVEYSVSGSDGYEDSGSALTNNEGEIHFDIPGGAAGVTDTIYINIPELGLDGSVSYTF